MKRLGRHAVIFIFFICLVLTILFLWSSFSDIFDLDIAYKDYEHEQETESWNYVLNVTNELAMLDSKNEKELKKIYQLYSSLPEWDSVIDKRTLIDPDYYYSLNLKCLSGAQHRAAAERINEDLKNDSLTLKEEINDLSSSDKTYPVTDNEEEREYQHNLEKEVPPGHRWQWLESPTVERVEPLLSGSRTRPGERTRLNRTHLAAIHPRLRKKVLQNEIKYFDIPRRKMVRAPTYRWKSFYITLNLFNSEDLLPFMTEALVAFIEDELAPFFDIRTSVVVVIYASLSEDLTAPLVRSLLIPYLQKAGVETIFATVSGSCQGYLKKQFMHERIEWMQCVRNKAMEPLQELGMSIFSKRNSTESFDIHSWGNESNLEFNINDFEDVLGKPGGSSLDEDDLVVLFLNDIFFRPHDLTRLLETEPEAQMAAQIPPNSVPLHRDEDNKTTDLSKDSTVQTDNKANVRESHGSSRSGASSAHPRGSFDIACGMDFYYLFYDTWVSRDRLGGSFLPYMPYSDDRETRDAIGRILSGASTEGAEKSYGVLVKCCWNGVGAIRGRFFLPQRNQRDGLAGLGGRERDSPPASPAAPVALPHPGQNETNDRPDASPPMHAETKPISSHREEPQEEDERYSHVTLLNPLLAYATHAPSPLGQDIFFYIPKNILCGLLPCGELVTQDSLLYSTAWWESQLNVYVNKAINKQDRNSEDLALPLTPDTANLSVTKQTDRAAIPFKIKVLRVYKYGICAKVPYMTTSLSRLSLFNSFRVPSGVIFDRIGYNYSAVAERQEDESQKETNFLIGLEKHYEHVLIRRLVSLRKLWRDAHKMVSKVSDRKASQEVGTEKLKKKSIRKLQAELHAYVWKRFIHPQGDSSTQRDVKERKQEPLDKKTTRGNVPGLFRWIQLPLNITQVNLSFSHGDELSNSVAKSKAQHDNEHQPCSSNSPSFIPQNTTSMDEQYVLNDAVYYQARTPTLRFRHSFTPSFGATLFKKGYEVDDNVCLSSECLLVCEDIMHATLLRESRTPVILMNPLVQVAYEKDHLDRVIGTWLYTSPRLFYIALRLRDIQQVWMSIWRWPFGQLKLTEPSNMDGTTESMVGPGEQRGQLGQGRNPRKQRKKNSTKGSLGLFTSAADDLLYDTPASVFYKEPLSVVVGHSGWNGSGKRQTNIDITSYTSMVCSGYSNNEFNVLFTWIYWAGIMLVIVLQLLFLYEDINAGIQTKFVALTKEISNERGWYASSQGKTPLPDWRDFLALSDLDYGLTTRSQNSALLISEPLENASAADASYTEFQKELQQRWKKFVLFDNNPNVYTGLLETSALYALTPEERVWVRGYAMFKTRLPWHAFRSRRELRKWSRVLSKVASSRVSLLWRRFSKLFWAPRTILMLYQKCFRKLLLKVRFASRNRRR